MVDIMILEDFYMTEKQMIVVVYRPSMVIVDVCKQTAKSQKPTTHLGLITRMGLLLIAHFFILDTEFVYWIIQHIKQLCSRTETWKSLRLK